MLVTKGLRLALAWPVRQAEPVNPEILMNMFKFVDIQDEEQIMAWTELLYGFHLLDKSNLVPDTQKEFHPEKQIARQDICLAKHTVLVNIQWSKTLQYKEKLLHVPLIQLKNKLICPVHWMWKLVLSVNMRPSDPLFCYHRKGKFMTLTYPWLTYWFKLWLEKCGMPAKLFSLHSCRRGGVTFLHTADIPAQMIKLLGNWASKAYLRYIDIMLSKRVEVVCRFADIIEEE